jgi:hypothetical protein
MEDFPLSLTPIYSTAKVDKPIQLYRGTLILDAGGQSFAGMGRITLEWLPKPSVRWYLKKTTPPLSPIISPSPVALQLKSVPNKVQAQMTTGHFSGGAGAKPPSVEGYIENGEGKHFDGSLSGIVFHLANFIPFLGDAIRNPGGGIWKGRANLRGDGWKLTLDGINSRSALSSEDGGFVISHVGHLGRDDGRPFPLSEARALLHDLYWYFSFCRGKPSAPVLPVGIDSSGQITWSEWANWNVARLSSNHNWYNDFSAQGLEGTFGGFVSLNKDPLWGDAIKLAIYWYLEAGRVGNDTAIIIAQAAFEKLAWTFLVKDKKLVSVTKLKAMNVADQLRELLKFMGIPSTVPASLAELGALASQKRWHDGPQALTGIRNSMVHSAGNRPPVAANAQSLFEASMLSLWYLELAILYLLGYAGKYSNRLVMTGWKGQEVESFSDVVTYLHALSHPRQNQSSRVGRSLRPALRRLTLIDLACRRQVRQYDFFIGSISGIRLYDQFLFLQFLQVA